MSTLPPLVERIARLIALPSASSHNPAFDQGNRAVIELLAEWCEALGFRVRIQEVRPGKANLIATLGEGEGGLVLSGHSDTVPCEAERWSSAPHALELRDGRLYGLGSADMKGFFSVTLEAASRIEAWRLRHPLILLATADEESTMHGAEALRREDLAAARYAVIGEPTGLVPIRMHKGMMMVAVRLTGRAGHSSEPARGNSALEGMQRVMGELLAWRGQLQAGHRNELFQVAEPTLNLGYIRGGDAANRICGQCELQFDLRPLPGMACEALFREIEGRLQALLEGSGLGLELERLYACDAMETPPDSPLVQAVEELSGRSAEAVAYATEGPYLAALGLDTVILGPGHIAQAHRPDEYLELAQAEAGVELFSRLIGRLCG